MGTAVLSDQPKTDIVSQPTGRATMSSAIAQAGNYHRYLLGKALPFLGHKVWEIGSGYGQYTRLLLEHDFEVLASEIDNELRAELENLTGAVQGLYTARIDLNDPQSIKECGEWSPDSIICFNVLEHISDDVAAVRNIRESVPLGTRAVFITPAHAFLYGFMDKEAGHFRRYSRQSLRDTFTKAGWKVIKCIYLNPVGAIGWLFRNRLRPPASQSLNDPRVNKDIELFDRYLLPISQIVEPLTHYLLGQSVIIIAENKET